MTDSGCGRSLRGAVAVVGVADAVSPSGELECRGRALEAMVVREALEDAGLAVSDVDGLCASGNVAGLAEYMGISPRFVDSTFVGGSSPELHLEHAAAAIAAGLCDVVVAVYAQTPRLDRRLGQAVGGVAMAGPDPQGDWERACGLISAMGSYALVASSHMARFGTTSQQLAQIAVDTRRWAERNPRARYQTPISVEDVLSSPVSVSPLHKLDCCLVSDGAAAVVITSAERAAHCRRLPAYLLGAASASDHWSISQSPDLTTSPGARSGPTAFQMAGVGPGDVDVLMAYDSFTVTVLLHLEDLGFCAKGEGGPFAASGVLGPGGSLPTNTNGGGLSYTHPGQCGMFLLVEATRQL